MAPLQYLTRIHDPIWIERILEFAHQVQLQLVLVTRHLGKFQLSDAVLGTEQAAKIDDDVVDGFGDAIRLLEESLFVAADRLGDVVVDIAVAAMAKSDRLGTGKLDQDVLVIDLDQGVADAFDELNGGG